MAADIPVLAPKVLIIPQADRVSGCKYEGNAYATTGAMLMSGAMLFFYDGSAWSGAAMGLYV